jgi:hypothetical protein
MEGSEEGKKEYFSRVNIHQKEDIDMLRSEKRIY